MNVRTFFTTWLERLKQKSMHGNRNLPIRCKFVIAQMRKATQASGPFVPANQAQKLNRSCCASVPLMHQYDKSTPTKNTYALEITDCAPMPILLTHRFLFFSG